jgi:hypothetical protein
MWAKAMLCSCDRDCGGVSLCGTWNKVLMAGMQAGMQVAMCTHVPCACRCACAHVRCQLITEHANPGCVYKCACASVWVGACACAMRVHVCVPAIACTLLMTQSMDSLQQLGFPFSIHLCVDMLQSASMVLWRCWSV